MHASISRRIYLLPLTLLCAALVVGCSGNKKLLTQKNMRITELEARTDSLQTVADQERRDAERMKEELRAKIADLKEEVDLCMEEKERLTKITLPGRVTFAFGSARLTDEGRGAIDGLWEVLAKYPDRSILIEGHTDDVPIDEDYRHLFRSNWELSTARANAVLHYLIDKHGAGVRRLSAVGYGEYHPVATNETPEGRSKNRRVVISVRD